MSNYSSACARARSRQRHAPLSPARRRLRTHGPRSSPRDRPHAGPGAPTAALLAAGPRAMPPGGRPACAAAHGRVPERPGGPRRPCRLPAQQEVERRRLQVQQLGTSGRAALMRWENLRREPGLGMGAAPRTQPLESALRRTGSPPRRGHVELLGRGAPGAGGGWLPGRAEVRQGSKRSARRCGRPRGPRETNGRNRNAQEEGAGGQGPGAGRVAGPTSSRALGQQLSPRRRLRPRVLRCHEPEGGGRSRESWGSDARRQRRPGHVPLARPISPGGRGDVREAARPMTAVPSHVAGRTPMGGARAT